MDWTADKADVLRLKVVIGLCSKCSHSHLGGIEMKLVLYAVQFILTTWVEHNFLHQISSVRWIEHFLSQLVLIHLGNEGTFQSNGWVYLQFTAFTIMTDLMGDGSMFLKGSLCIAMLYRTGYDWRFTTASESKGSMFISQQLATFCQWTGPSTQPAGL